MKAAAMNGAKRMIPVSIEGAAPPTAREWVSFEDPDEQRHWVFDVSFMLSRWTCIFGAGCQGVLTGPAEDLVQGCCSYGAHFVDDADVARVEAVAATLTDEEWQFRKKGRKGITRRNKENEIVTKQADGACVFLNRPGWPTGPGCALHYAAVTRGLRPLDLKPTVCWQLPLRREEETLESGWVTTRVIPWEREHWGGGGEEFHWWCTESPDAFVGDDAVYLTMREELIELVGQPIYDMLATYLDTRRTGTVPVPFPTERPSP
jgi:hypothetical protein